MIGLTHDMDADGLREIGEQVHALYSRGPFGVPGMPCCEAVKVRYGPCRGNRDSKPTASSRGGVGRKV